MRAPRSTRVVTVAALAAVACGNSNGEPPVVLLANPAFGPLAGGTIVELVGSGFLADAAAPDHVVVGGIESPLASVIDDHTLQFLLPPGNVAGDVAIGVFNQNGNGSATGIFHYSSTPSVATVSPGKVLFSSSSTTVTLTGSGFQSEDAGPVTVLVDDAPAVDVVVQNDSQLTFTALPDQPLVSPTVTVVDSRGSGSLAHAFLYVPSNNPGLVMFPNDGRTFFTFFDPVGNTTSTVLLKTENPDGLHLRAVVFEPDGSTIAMRSDGIIGQLDMSSQQIGSAVQIIDRIPAAALVNGTVYGVSMSRNILVSIDPATGIAMRVGSGAFACCGTALAANGSGTLYYLGPQTTNGSAFISVLDPVTGALSNTVAVTPTEHVSEMRFLGSTLFAVGNAGLMTINPATGSATVVEALPFQATALEVVQ
jgi:hypothetical protein